MNELICDDVSESVHFITPEQTEIITQQHYANHVAAEDVPLESLLL